jgi:hypothetical protein
MIRLVVTIFGGLFLFFFLTIRGGVPDYFIAMAAIPFLVGLLTVVQWARMSPERREAIRTAANAASRAQPRFSVAFMLLAWIVFFVVLGVFWQQTSTGGSFTWVVVGVLILCLVLIPVQIIRYIRNKAR